MKYLKMLALTAVAAGALMAFIGAGTASATVICSTTATPCPTVQKWPATTTLDWSVPAGASLNLKEPGPSGETIDTCTEGTVHGTFTQGSPMTTPIMHVEKAGLTWGKCTFPTSTVTGGTLEIHSISGSSNGTATGSKFEVTINTIFFGSCIYGTGEGLDLGTVTEGKPGIFHAEAVVKRLSGSQIACPEKAEWSGTYTLTTPSETTAVVEPE